MVDVKALRQTMTAKGWTVEKLADAMGVDRATLFRRFQNGGQDFTVKEVNTVVDVLQLSQKEAHSIFFPDKVA